MKNTFSKTIGIALAILVMATLAQISVSAQDRDHYKGARALEGVWDIIVTSRNCDTGDVIRTFPSMQTFMQGGTMTDWGAGTPPSLRGLGQGVWHHLDGLHFESAFELFRFNANGTLAGKQINRAEIELSEDGEVYTTISHATVFDVNGNAVANNCATATATRFE
jgi:hypothetical protein